MSRAGGFEVQDLGTDSPPSKFAEEAERLRPNIVAASALMTTSRPVLIELVEYFRAVRIREKYRIMIGGAPITQEYADEIGADGYAPDAIQAARLAEKLVHRR
jgi:5-methyltetrahydrofolate--homocysteine methyltransferase